MTTIKIKGPKDNPYYEIDGKIYSTYEELPDCYKRLLEDKNRDGKPDLFEGMKKTTITRTTYHINGKEYNSLEEIPPEIREKIKSACEEKDSQTRNLMPNKNNIRDAVPIENRSQESVDSERFTDHIRRFFKREKKDS